MEMHAVFNYRVVTKEGDAPREQPVTGAGAGGELSAIHNGTL